MSYNHTVRNDGTATVRVVCAVVFIVFTFLWLFFFQADVMYVVQHVLSGGKTHYSRLWGAILITLALLLLQWGVFRLTGLARRCHALTWLPSMLLLAVLSSASPDAGRSVALGHWWWLMPLILLLWGVAVWIARTVQPYEKRAMLGLFSRTMWGNLLIMALLIIGVAIAGNTNAVYHFRVHAEMALLRGDTREALRVGNRSLETDASLMMLRMYALSRQRQLGEQLFEYPLVPTSRAMLPTTDAVCLQVYPADSIYRHLGAIPRGDMLPMDYLRIIFRHGQAKPAAADYLLCGYLIDRDLDSFAREVGHYYAINDSLPRHYREALVLYTHMRSHPAVVYHDPVLDVDYNDLRAMEDDCKLPSERRIKLMENYADSYWNYFISAGAK